MVTLKEIACRVGVTPTVVSCTLNRRFNRIRVSEAKQREILEVARLLGYTPNRSARTLVTRRNHALGLLLPGDNSASPSVDANANRYTLLSGMNAVAQARGYRILHDCIDFAAPAPFEDPVFLRERGVDALAVNGYISAAVEERLKGYGLPLLHIGTNLEGTAGIASVSAAMTEATRTLLAQAAAAGLPSLHLHLPKGPGPCAIARDLAGYARSAFPGVEVTTALTGVGMDELLQHGRELAIRPPALLISSLRHHLPLLHGLKERGIACPQEVQFIAFTPEGYHNERLAANLGTIAQIILPYAAIGERVAAQLITVLEGEATALREEALPCLSLPGSSAPFFTSLS